MKFKPRPADQKSANQDRLAIIDQTILILLTFAFTVLPAFLKMQSSDDGQSNSIKQVMWSFLYLACGVRLFQLNKIKQALMKLSIFWIFCGFMFLTAIWSVDQKVTFVDAIELTGSTVVASYLALRLKLNQLLRFLAWIFGFTIILSAIFLTVIRNHGYESWGSGGWAGFFPEKNALGATVSLGLITFGGLIFDSRGQRRTLYALGLIACAVLLIGSNSVTSIFVIVITAYVLGCIILCRSSIVARIMVVASIVALSIAYVAGLSPDALIIAMGRTPNLSGRDELWPFVKLAIADRPIFGYGYNAFFQSDIAAPFFTTAVAFQFHPAHSHNSFLQILVDGGYVGFSIFCFGLVKASIDSVVYAVKSLNPVGCWPLGVIIFLVMGSSDETYFPVLNSFNWLVLIAAALLTSPEKLRSGGTARFSLATKSLDKSSAWDQTATPRLQKIKRGVVVKKAR